MSEPLTDFDIRMAVGDMYCPDPNDPRHEHGCPADALFTDWLAAHDAAIREEVAPTIRRFALLEAQEAIEALYIDGDDRPAIMHWNATVGYVRQEVAKLRTRSPAIREGVDNE